MANVLSLFDGCSCGQLALERAKLKVDNYFASEIDKYAIQITQKNYPNTIQLGDIYNIDYDKLPRIDLILGGSPCTYWSIAKKDREITSSGIGFDMFMQYVKAVRTLKPKYFLYENNHSIHQDIKDAITKKLKVEPIMINSALLSSQQRKRVYWTNIPDIIQPKDKGLVLEDILEENVVGYSLSDKVLSNFKITNEKGLGVIGTTKPNDRIGQRDVVWSSKDKIGTLLATDYKQPKQAFVPIRIGHIGKGSQSSRIYSIEGKTVCLNSAGGNARGMAGLYKVDLPDGNYIIRKLTPVECERLQTLDDGYTEGVSNTQRYKMIGNGWTIDVITHILNHIPRIKKGE